MEPQIAENRDSRPLRTAPRLVERFVRGYKGRRCLGFIACGVAALAAPAAASAAATDVSITTSLKTLTVRAATNSTNFVTISADLPGDRVLVTDAGSGVATNDAPCSTPTPGTISCPLGQLTKIEVTLNNRDDRATITGLVPASIPTSLDGGTNNDLLIGGRGADTLSGSSNNDLMDGGAGRDTFRGGSGTDAVTYASHLTGVTASIGGRSGQDGGATDGPPGGADTINGDVENLVGSRATDLLIGDRHNNSLFGTAGNDFLVGEGGNDYLNGGADVDFLLGNTGGDFLDGGPGADLLRGNKDNDHLFARDGERDLSLKCGRGRDRLRRDSIDPRGKSCSHKRHRHKHRR